MIKRNVCFCCTLFLVWIVICRVVLGVQWEPKLHPQVTQAQMDKTVTVQGKVIQKKQQSEKQILYISYKKSKTIIYNKQIQNISYGDTIKVTGTLTDFELPPNPGNFNQQFYYFKEGVRAAIFAEQIEVQGSSSATIWNQVQEMLFHIKVQWEQIFTQSLGPEQGAIMAGIILGNKSQMDTDVKELYQKSGIGHILAISGLHISFIGIGIYQFMRRLGMSFKSAGSISVLILILYTCMVGAGVSSVRAVIMLFIRIGADILGRVYDIKTSLAIAAISLVAWRPLYLFDPGFLLSFGAIVGIVFIYPVLKELNIIKYKVLEGLWVSLSINLILLPMLLYFYFEFPLYSLLLNMFVIPLMSVVLGVGMIGSGVFLMVPFLGKGVLKLCGIVLWFYEESCRITSGFPFARIVVGKPKEWQIITYYMMLIIVLIIVGKKKRGNNVISWKKRIGHIMLAGTMFIVIWIPGHGKQGYIDVTMLNVGQGDGLFIRGPFGQTYFVDGGSSDVKEVGKYRIEPYLKSKGIGEIDYVFLSHGDADHINGIEELLMRQKVGVKIRTIVLPGQKELNEGLEKIGRLAIEKGTKVLVMNEKEQLIEGKGNQKMKITCLHPNKTFVDKSENSKSMVLEIEAGDFQMILTGDVEGTGENQLYENIRTKEYDILKVAHHGSKNSTSSKFLEKVSPKIALISAGEKNRYGHPHQETMELLESQGCKIYDTSKDGAVEFVIPVK